LVVSAPRVHRTSLALAAVATLLASCIGASTVTPSLAPASPSATGSAHPRPSPSASATLTPGPSLQPTLPPTTPAPTSPPSAPPSARPTLPLEPGDSAHVSVVVATGWREPGSARRVDAPALAYPVRIREWLGSLSQAEQEGLIGRTDTQVLLGEPVRIREVRGSWIRVTVPAQATPLDPDGYPVWIPARQLTAGASPAATTTATVTTPTAWLEDDSRARQLELSFGTRLPVVSSGDRQMEVSLPDGRTLWIASAAVAVGHADRPAITPTATSIVDTARRFIGTRYLWAGTSGFGFDCSGLVYAVYRLHGIELPRDSDPQSRAGHAVSRADLRAGDLVFFGSGGRVHHVAIYAGGGRIIESPFVGGDIREVDLAGRDGYVGARRVLP
jgi:cell wall-associated NlpC family hydrolase